MNQYQRTIHQSRYARWLDEENRRETWSETVSRYCATWKDVLSEEEMEEIYSAIYNMEVMPSMRQMWAAGPALEKNSITGYNCSFIAIDDYRAFDETLYILACGTGVGFSVESKHVTKLPIINDHFEEIERVIKVEDSKEGWAKALRKHIADLYLGRVNQFDYSLIRPKGARLKTMGGRASGPQPFIDLIDYCTKIFENAAGRKLSSLECHDIMCKIGEIVVVGGVRRSAMISLSDLGDDQLRSAKSGQWWLENSQRALSNNSAVYRQKPDIETFMKEWLSLIESKSGERGIYSRYGAQKNAPERREGELIQGTNPCAEIALRSGQFCNLTEVVARRDDTVEDLLRKVKIAAILGTLQASLTKFPYLRKFWTRNTEEEALLGVSLTGIQDNPILNGTSNTYGKNIESILGNLKDWAVITNKNWSERIGINPAAAVTTVKPSGTVSQLVDSSSGIHGRMAPYYIRTVRQSKDDPLTQFLIDKGVPAEDDKNNPMRTSILSFPMKSPEGAVMANEQTAIEQLEMWKTYKTHWAEHSVSVTIYVKQDEWLKVGSWVYDNFDYLTGVSFMPYSDHVYDQAPYQPISEEEYAQALSTFPNEVDWTKLGEYEQEDNTEGAKELACVGGVCEI